MILTTKGRYAVMAILDLASNPALKPVQVKDISLRQNIDAKYLEQIFNNLRKAGLVKSVKGPGGGYLLNVALNELNIATIIDASAENIKMTRCSQYDAHGCLANQSKCSSHYLWDGLSTHIRKYFESLSVLDVLSKSTRTAKELNGLVKIAEDLNTQKECS